MQVRNAVEQTTRARLTLSQSPPPRARVVCSSNARPDVLGNNILAQQVVETTRGRGSNKPSLLDLVITENEQTLKSPVVHEAPIGSSDHCVLTRRGTTWHG